MVFMDWRLIIAKFADGFMKLQQSNEKWLKLALWLILANHFYCNALHMQKLAAKKEVKQPDYV